MIEYLKTRLGIIIVSVIIAVAIFIHKNKTFAQCPDNMVKINEFCIDKYEAPNKKGAFPLIMFSKIQAEKWCKYRNKRLCFDDEWTRACQGPNNYPYPYGNKLVKGQCNDNQIGLFRNIDAHKQHYWPEHISSSIYVQYYEQQYNLAKAYSSHASTSADYIDFLYKAKPSGHKTTCKSHEGVYDLMGNVEEWTQRRLHTRKNFTGKLKGRFWAESYSCNQSVTNHADGFNMYETGFRCCADL